MRSVFALIAACLYLLSTSGDFGCALGRGAAVVRSFITDARSGGHRQEQRCPESQHEVSACNRLALNENLESDSFGAISFFRFIQSHFITGLTFSFFPIDRYEQRLRHHLELPVLQKAYLQLRVFRI